LTYAYIDFIAQVMVAQKVTAGVYRGVTTSELDELAAETAAAMTSTHPDYALVCNALLGDAFGSVANRCRCDAARCPNRSVELAQEHPQVLQRDVSRCWS
jgi:hypothetical protein